jgi:organic hydroperoxide reductase OsmC/OhrA
MAEHSATVEWQLQGEFKYEVYSRAHTIDFGKGVRLSGNAAAGNIPKTAPGTPGADPEQQLVAALSSCHMLWFLHLACNRNFVVESYRDDASGVLAKDGDGKEAVTRITLRPIVKFSGVSPSDEDHRDLHEKAHERCFIANSVKSEVILEPRIA